MLAWIALLQTSDALFEAPEKFRGDLGGYRSPLKFEDGRPVTTAAEWAERRKELVKAWTRILGEWPPLLEAPRVKVQWTEKSPEGFQRSRVEIDVAPGRKTAAFLLVPEGKGPFPGIVDVFYYPEDGAGLKEDRRGQNDFGYQLAKRGFVALCVGQNPTGPQALGDLYWPDHTKAQMQPLSYLAYVAANAHTVLAQRPDVDPSRIGVVGHSYGGKWSLFAGALYEKFAAVAVSDPGIVFEEKMSNVNYWEPWYLGYEPGKNRERGVLRPGEARMGAYKTIVDEGRDLHELHALICPRPFFTAGGDVDPPRRWQALNHSVAVNKLLGVDGRVGMSNRPQHKISPEACEQIASFFVSFLGRKP